MAKSTEGAAGVQGAGVRSLVAFGAVTLLSVQRGCSSGCVLTPPALVTEVRPPVTSCCVSRTGCATMDGGDGTADLVINKRFVSESELEERRKRRQEEWEKVRKPEDPEGTE